MLHILKWIVVIVIIASTRLTLSVYDSIDIGDCEKAKKRFLVMCGLVFLLILIITIIFTVPDIAGLQEV